MLKLLKADAAKCGANIEGATIVDPKNLIILINILMS